MDLQGGDKSSEYESRHKEQMRKTILTFIWTARNIIIFENFFIREANPLKNVALSLTDFKFCRPNSGEVQSDFYPKATKPKFGHIYGISSLIYGLIKLNKANPSSPNWLILLNKLQNLSLWVACQLTYCCLTGLAVVWYFCFQSLSFQVCGEFKPHNTTQR